MKIINNNPRFGTEGPYEADSFEALADDMGPTFSYWAAERFLNRTRLMNDEEIDDFLSGTTQDEITDSYRDEIRKEFMAGLEELTE